MKDKELLSTDYTLKASNEVYWGLAIIGAGLGLLGYFFESQFVKNVFYGLTTLIGGASVIDMVFYQKKHTHFIANNIEILRGIIKRKEVIPINTIKKFDLFGDNSHHLGEIKTFDFAENTNIIKKLKLTLQDYREIEFNSYDYNKNAFLDFIRKIQQKHIEISSTQTEKLQLSATQCDNLLRQDKQLVMDLTEAMQDAYKSVYETHVMCVQDEEKEFAREQIKNLEAVYFYSYDNKIYYYFLKYNYLPSSEAEDVVMAHNLIETSLKNLVLVENRIQAYKQVQLKMAKIIEKQLHRTKLQNVADKLNNLQQKNISNNENQDEIHFDAEVFEQYSNMINQIQQVETAEQAEFLKQYITEISKLK